MSDTTCHAKWINPDWPTAPIEQKGFFTLYWPKDKPYRGRPKHTESKKYYARLYRKQDRIMSQYYQDLKMGRKIKVVPQFGYTWLQRIT